jgi:hypothetical protein
MKKTDIFGSRENVETHFNQPREQREPSDQSYKWTPSWLEAYIAIQRGINGDTLEVICEAHNRSYATLKAHAEGLAEDVEYWKAAFNQADVTRLEALAQANQLAEAIKQTFRNNDDAFIREALAQWDCFAKASQSKEGAQK